MTAKISTFFLFTGAQHGKAEEAILLYTRLFDNAGVVSMEKYGPGENQPEGTVKVASFRINGSSFMAIDSAMAHNFSFTPAISLFVEMDDEKKLAEIFSALSEGGSVLMPLDQYPFSKKFGWLADRYGVNWQLSLV